MSSFLFSTASFFWIVFAFVHLFSLILNQGCGKLVKAGADGVVQAMVLSYAGLKFREEHLELNSHPKDLHRDYHIRRVSYGNATHLNISIVVQVTIRDKISLSSWSGIILLSKYF